jgi:hypothetical protein
VGAFVDVNIISPESAVAVLTALSAFRDRCSAAGLLPGSTRLPVDGVFSAAIFATLELDQQARAAYPQDRPTSYRDWIPSETSLVREGIGSAAAIANAVLEGWGLTRLRGADTFLVKMGSGRFVCAHCRTKEAGSLYYSLSPEAEKDYEVVLVVPDSEWPKPLAQELVAVLDEAEGRLRKALSSYRERRGGDPEKAPAGTDPPPRLPEEVSQFSRAIEAASDAFEDAYAYLCTRINEMLEEKMSTARLPVSRQPKCQSIGTALRLLQQCLRQLEGFVLVPPGLDSFRVAGFHLAPADATLPGDPDSNLERQLHYFREQGPAGTDHIQDDAFWRDGVVVPAEECANGFRAWVDEWRARCCRLAAVQTDANTPAAKAEALTAATNARATALSNGPFEADGFRIQDVEVRFGRAAIMGQSPPEAARDKLKLIQDDDRGLRQANNLPADVPLDQSTLAAAQGMLAHLDSLATSNMAMRQSVVDLAARLGGGTTPLSSGPADPFVDLRRFARTELKGQERAVIEALCDANGELSLADVKARCDWQDPIESSWNSLRTRLNKKLGRLRWRLITRDRTARLTKQSQE